MTDHEDDEVGYGKPPKSGRFKKGQSGNPKGRPKGVKNFQTDLRNVLRSRMTVKVSGKAKSVTVVEAALMRLREKALKGDQRALETILRYAQEVSAGTDARSRERELTALEKEILGRSMFLDHLPATEGPLDEKD